MGIRLQALHTRENRFSSRRITRAHYTRASSIRLSEVPLSHLPDPPAAAPLPESQDTFVPSSDNGLLLFTGNPITAEEEAQFIDSAARVFFGPAAVTKSAEGNAISRADS